MFNWQLAERYTQAAAERYQGSELYWYFFCRRTGQGDLQAAKSLARKYLQDPATPPAWLENFWIGDFYLLEGETETALKHFERCHDKSNDPYDGLRVAVVADQMKDAKRRDAMLLRIKEKGPEFIASSTGKPRTELLSLVQWMIDGLAKGGKGDIDLAAADKVGAAVEVDLQRMNYYYYLGKYLDLHGKPERAIHYWKLCLTHTGMDDLCRNLAGVELLQRGYSPDCYLTLLADQKPNDAKGKPEKPEKTDAKSETKPGEAAKRTDEPSKTSARPEAADKGTPPENKKPDEAEGK